MSRKLPRKTLLMNFILLASSPIAFSGGFSLYTEGSAAAIGNFAAGIAAEAADASIGWYNPAGLPLLGKEQVVLGAVGVLPHTDITGSSVYETEDVPAYIQGFNQLSGGKNALVPSVHYARPLGQQAAFGFSVISPFGLSTNWGTTSPVRYAGTLTELLTMNASPELGGKLTDNLSIGSGLDLQWARVKFNSVIGSPAALQYLESIGGLVTPTTLDSTSDNTGNSFAVGFHVGLLSTFNENHTRLGVNYQSRIHHVFYGTSQLTGRLADPELTNPDAVYSNEALRSNEVELPNIVTLSGYQDVTPQLAFLGSAVFTGWSSYSTVQLFNVAAYSPDESVQLPVNVTVNEDYRDTWRFALGANYRVNSDWMMRLGGGYDQTPTVHAERDVRLPDSDRWALSVGAHYQAKPSLGFDAGFTYLFVAAPSSLNKTQAIGTSSAYTVAATAHNHAALFGLQAVWKMDQVA